MAEHWGDDLAERAERALDALADLAPWQSEMIACRVLGIDDAEYAGMPQAPLFNHMDQAAFWADMAEPVELDAYCLASFNRMHPARQSAFLAFVQRGQAA